MDTFSFLKTKNFYKPIVLNMLSKMNKGKMTLIFPSGESLCVGNGTEVSANIQIRNERFFKRCVLFGDIGFGESYVDKDWDTDNIVDVIKWFLLNIENSPEISGSKTTTFVLNILKLWNKILHWRNVNNINGAKKNISAHYDLNNDFFKLFLDPTLTYSSAYFGGKEMHLQDAQMEKYRRICEKLKLKSSDRVLEIGSGWGANAIFMAKNYGCHVTTITISEEQYKFVKEKVAQENLSDKIQVELKDYREVHGQFDKIISIEMLEAVGEKFFETYFGKCHELLRKNGLLGLQVIICPDTRYKNLRNGVDWIQKHIFPGSLLPSVARINSAINFTGDMSLLDLKEFGLDYAKTLSIWREQFNKNLSEVRKLGFSEKFIRKWNYYLSYCEAAFAMRNIYVMQMIYSRPNNFM